jgi:hypothetical protein
MMSQGHSSLTHAIGPPDPISTAIYSDHPPMTKPTENPTSTEISLLVFIASIFYVLFNGYVISVLWRWFAVPLGIPPISVVHGIGIDLLVGLLVFKAIDLNASADDRLKVAFAPVVTLAIAWPVHLLMG